MRGTAVDEPVPHRIDVHAEFPHQCENRGNRRCAVKLSLRLVLGPTAIIADRERGVGLPEPIDSAFQKPLLVAGCPIRTTATLSDDDPRSMQRMHRRSRCAVATARARPDRRRAACHCDRVDP